jgi:hypothetical protein
MADRKSSGKIILVASAVDTAQEEISRNCERSLEKEVNIFSVFNSLTCLEILFRREKRWDLIINLPKEVRAPQGEAWEKLTQHWNASYGSIVFRRARDLSQTVPYRLRCHLIF